MEPTSDQNLEIVFNDYVYFLTITIAAPIDVFLNVLGIVVIVVSSSSEIGLYKWYLLNLQASYTICLFSHIAQ